MADRPVLHVTNHASRKLHRGRVYTIMAAPRRWEHGAGTVWALVPALEDLRDLHEGRLEPGAYRRRFEDRLRAELDDLAPGRLWATTRGVTPDPRWPDDHRQVLRDGDTVCCACARGAPCHRRWAVPFLQRAGWSVVLDGVALSEPSGPCLDCEERPEVGCCLDGRDR